MPGDEHDPGDPAPGQPAELVFQAAVIGNRVRPVAVEQGRPALATGVKLDALPQARITSHTAVPTLPRYDYNPPRHRWVDLARVGVCTWLGECRGELASTRDVLAIERV